MEATATAAITNNKPVPKPSTTGKGMIAEPSNDYLIPFSKGDALVKLGKYNESIQYFDKALAINPKFVRALNDKGVALFVLGKYNESIQYFDKALAINPNYPVSLLDKGSALNKLGKYKESISYYNKVLAKEPTNPQASAGKKLDLVALGIPQDPSMFGFYFGPTNTTATSPTNAHTQKPILTCDQPGHASCYSLGYSKGLSNTELGCSATTVNSFTIANPSQVNNFCSGYRVAAQQALQQQR